MKEQGTWPRGTAKHVIARLRGTDASDLIIADFTDAHSVTSRDIFIDGALTSPNDLTFALASYAGCHPKRKASDCPVIHGEASLARSTVEDAQGITTHGVLEGPSLSSTRAEIGSLTAAL